MGRIGAALELEFFAETACASSGDAAVYRVHVRTDREGKMRQIETIGGYCVGGGVGLRNVLRSRSVCCSSGERPRMNSGSLSLASRCAGGMLLRTR